MLRDVPAARAGRGAGSDAAVLRAVLRHGQAARRGFRARGQHVARESGLGCASSATPSTTSPRQIVAASRSPRRSGTREEEPGRPVVISAPVRARGRRLQPRRSSVRGAGAGVPRVAGRNHRRHGGRSDHGPDDHVRRGGDRHRPSGDGRRHARGHLVHRRDGRPVAERAALSRRRSRRSTRETGRRRGLLHDQLRPPDALPVRARRPRAVASHPRHPRERVDQ